MTSRPGPGIHESLQRRGSRIAPHIQHRRRRPSKPINNPPYALPQDCIDPTLEDQRRPAEETQNKSRGISNTRPKPVPLEGIHTSTTADAARPPPKGRPQLFFTNSAGTGSDTPLQSPYNQPANTLANFNFNSGLPLPPRPGNSRFGESAQQQRIHPGGTGVKGAAAAKAPSNDAPASSTLFAGGKTADFFPWSGGHSEDLLNEALVKAGISNKPQIMNETNTARPSLWSNLKNKSGLSTLSTLFVAVLEKRQAIGRLTTPHSFKPPPRLTLRDSNRETWLHDLANSTIGLRRLSRTIPHGITGRVLLDHCLNKNIALPRAVWLAKCVGINEMRSHKRKGQAGTITWVRGWTSSVEQYLDSNIAKMGQPDWKRRFTYALQLAICLYKEHLLENEHFLDWILKGLDSSPPERLFLWLLIATLFGTELSASRRRGKRMGESLLNHAEKLYPLEDEHAPTPIVEYLDKTLTKLLIGRPVCLLLPKTWERQYPLLKRLASRNPHPRVAYTVGVLDRRARRLMRPSQSKESRASTSAQEIITLLDSVDYSTTIRIEDLASTCMEIIPDASRLISSLLAWASSIYRDGSYRAYLVVRLLRRLSQLGVDIDESILSYLRSPTSPEGSHPHNLFRIIADLVRSKTFSVGQYLQWLIATGSLSSAGGQDPLSSSSWASRLIIEIPLTGLPEQVRNLRSTLLRGGLSATEIEEKILDEAEYAIQDQLPNLFGIDMIEYPSSEVDFARLSSTVKLELAVTLRLQVARSVEMMDHVPTKDPSVTEHGPVCLLTSQEFHIIRSHLEDFGDLSMLADIITSVTSSLDGHVLAFVAETLNYHRVAFMALGAFEPLFRKTAMRYAAIRTIRFPERELLISLSDLVRIAGADEFLTQALAYDLSRHDQKNSIAACSPVSDTMVEVSHSVAQDSDEEIDRILSSGTSMDQQIMTRVFGKIIINLEEQVKKNSTPSGSHTVWLNRLRSFDESAFDAMVTEWLGSLIVNQQTKLCHAVLPPLIVAGCATLAQVLEIGKDRISKRKIGNLDEALRMCIITLDLLIPSDRINSLCPVQEAYRYRLEQRKFCQDSEGSVLTLIREIIDLGANSLTLVLQNQIMSLFSSNRVRTVLKHYALQDMQLFATALGVGSDLVSQSSCLKTLLDGLLDPSNKLALFQRSLEDQVVCIVDSADYLSLPFCQLEIRQLFAMATADVDISVDSISSALLEAVKSAVEKDESPWSDLVAGLEANLTNKIREHAERELLSASTFLCTPSAAETERSFKEDDAFIQKYLTVIAFTCSDAVRSGQASIFTALIERFKGAGDAFSKMSHAAKSDVQPGSPIALICLWINALLRLTVVQGPMSLQKVPHQHQAALLWSLRLLLTHPVLDSHHSVTQFIFDVASILSDVVSDDVRIHLARLDMAKPVDNRRSAFLFGSHYSPDCWLALAIPVPPPTTAASASASQTTSSPQSQTTQSAHTPSPQQALQNSASPAPTLQRSQSQQQQSQVQQQNQNRMYSQYPQHSSNAHPNKMMAQFQQRMASPGGQNPNQLQQLQQMQAMQQRNTQPSPVQVQRQQSQSSPGAGNHLQKLGMPKPDKEMKLIPFALSRWEMLPESGGNLQANETAISMSLFGARRV